MSNENEHYTLILTKQEIDTLDQLLLIAGRTDSHEIRAVTCSFAAKLKSLLDDNKSQPLMPS